MGSDKGTVDYGKVLTDLRARRDSMNALIASIEALMPGLSGSLIVAPEMVGAGTLTEVPPMLNGGDIPAGAFFKKSIIEAAKLYLSLVMRKKTTHELAVALKEGGMESHSKNFERMVGILLKRASRNATSGIVKLKDGWGLADWYPAGFRMTQGKSESKTRKGKAKTSKARKNAQAESAQKMIAAQSESKVKEMPKAG